MKREREETARLYKECLARMSEATEKGEDPPFALAALPVTQEAVAKEGRLNAFQFERALQKDLREKLEK